MRIAYVINSVEGGGAALPVPAIGRVLRAHGHEVRVFALTRRDGRAIAAMAETGLEVVVRPGGERDHGAALAWLDARVAGWRPALLWTSLTRATLLGQLVGLRRRLPVVSWQHAAFLKPGNLRMLRATRRLTSLWIADSHCVAAITAARLGVPPARLATWPLFAADPGAPIAAPPPPGQPFRIGSLGRLHPVKGYDVLLDALARLGPSPPIAVEIAGEGDDRARLEAQARASGLDTVRFVGFREHPRDFLAGLQLYVQPSRSEGLCIAAHEAMQAGLPVIASGVGELSFSIVPGATGWIVPPDDPGRLAAALGEALAAPDRLAAMGDAARRRVLDRFGADAFARAGADVVARLPGPVADHRRAATTPSSAASHASAERPAR